MSEYFSHDYAAREDEKIKNLLFKHGFLGYGIYWAIVESLYQNKGYMQTHYKRIAFELRIDESVLISILNDFDLFKTHNEMFYSKSILHRLKLRTGKSIKAKKAAETRWSKAKQSNANAMQTHSNSNAIKEKESKVKETKEKKENSINWKNDFDVYKNELRTEYNRLINDSEFILTQEKYHPNIDIKLSIEKACVNYWSTEAGWKHKKKSKIEKIDWKATFINAIDLNKVYKPRTNDINGETNIQRINRIMNEK